MEASPSAPRGSRRTLVTALIAVAFGFLALGFVMGSLLESEWYAVWILALVCFAAAFVIATRTKPPDDFGGEPRAGEAGDARAGLRPEESVHDPTRNPYGRPEA